MRRLLCRSVATLAIVAVYPYPTAARALGSTAVGPHSATVDRPTPAQQPTAAVERATLVAVVLNAESGVPVSGARVAAGEVSVTTGADGRALLLVPSGSTTIEVTAPGYFAITASTDVRSTQQNLVELLLVQEPSFADRVDVRAPTLDAQPATRTVAPLEVLHTAGALDNIFRTLQTLPGVAATQEFAGFLSVRGGAPDQNLTMLDGVEVHDPYRLYGLASAFNPETIQRFDLSTGGFSARYGDRLSSLLMVDTRDGVSTRRVSGSASLSGTDANVIVEGKLPAEADGSWLVTGRRTYYDAIASLVSDQRFPRFADLQAKAVWRPRASTRLTVFGLRSRQGGDLRIDGEDVDAQFVDQTRNDLGWVRLQSSLGSRGHAMTVVGLSETLNSTRFDGAFADDGRRSNAPGTVARGTANVDFNLGINVRDLSLRHELEWSAAAHTLSTGFEVHQLSSGLDWSLRGDRNRNAANGSSIQGGAGLPDQLVSGLETTRGATWFEDTWALGAGASLQAALRVDRVGATQETLVSPRLTASWVLSPTTRVRSAFGRYTQSPGYEKLGQSDYLLDLSNPAASGIRSQKALLASVGIERDLGDTASLRVEWYDKRFRDVLVGQLESEADRLARLERYDFPAELAGSVPSSAIITSVPASAGTGRSHGFDVMLSRTSVPSGSRLRGWASYTWGRAEREMYGQRVPFEYDRRHAVTLVTSWQLTPQWDLATTARLASGFARTAPLGLRVFGIEDVSDSDGDGRVNELVPERDADGRLVYAVDYGGVANLQRARLPLFARFDVRLTWRPASKRWELYLEVLNALNRRNAGVLTPKLEHDPTQDRPRLVETRQQGLPILPTVGVRLRF